MAGNRIAELRDYPIGAAWDFPGALRADVVEDETGMFSVELEIGEQLFVADDGGFPEFEEFRPCCRSSSSIRDACDSTISRSLTFTARNSATTADSSSIARLQGRPAGRGAPGGRARLCEPGIRPVPSMRAHAEGRTKDDKIREVAVLSYGSARTRATISVEETDHEHAEGS